MIQISIVIVNYNVKYFLNLCLQSVIKASEGLSCQIIVVDNASKDGSIEMLRAQFPNVELISNQTNVGFSKANNQGFDISKGKYVLILNPDTVLPEDCFHKCIAFIETKTNAGAFGIRMIDGSGNFLPESKRGLPTPLVAFYKIFGFAALLPKSKTFGKYHLGFLNEHQNHEVEIMAGAFIFTTKDILTQCGGFDEAYFMYGEDIDLSYKIMQLGKKNYYFAESSIVHYKGESTKKQTVNYVRVFYKAMAIFAQKHYSKSNARLFTWLINVAIVFKATLSVVANSLKALMSPFLDGILIYIMMYYLKEFWENYIKAAEHLTYKPYVMQFFIPLYILIWLSSVYFSGGYDKPFKWKKMGRGILFGTVIIAAIYGLIEENYRFSRALILVGAIGALGIMTVQRAILQLLQHGNINIEPNETKRTLAIGSSNEVKRLLSLLQQSQVNSKFIGYINPMSHQENDEFCLGNIDDLPTVAKTFNTDEIIFCNKDISNTAIIVLMQSMKKQKFEFKILPQNSNFIIGSKSVDYPGDLYIPDFNLNLYKSEGKRNKRIADIVIALVSLILLPVLMLMNPKTGMLLSNIAALFTGKISAVGYGNKTNLLPIKPGILQLYNVKNNNLSINATNRLDLLYAKDYRFNMDISLFLKSLNKLDQKPI